MWLGRRHLALSYTVYICQSLLDSALPGIISLSITRDEADTLIMLHIDCVFVRAVRCGEVLRG